MTAGGRLGTAAARLGFLVGGKRQSVRYFLVALHAVNMVNCKTVLGCSLQLEATKLDKT